MADPVSKLLLGLVAGLLFGFALQKGRVTKFDVIVGQFRLRDFTVLKVMLTAVVVGGIGVYAFKAAGLAALHPKPAQIAAVVVGGLIFGIGMTLLGYCPGTGVAAAAEGKRDAMFGVLGMIAAALVFAELYAGFSSGILTVWNLGPKTLPEVMPVPAWAIFACLAVGAVALFRKLDRAGL